MTNVNTPYIGTSGNWYVDNEDTGVKAQGPIGHQGPVGPQGEIGPAGEMGDRGPQGFTGPKGEKGDEGPQGVQGIQGPQGEQGPIGETPELAANLTTTVAGKALDATMGKALNDKINANTSSISSLNSNLRVFPDYSSKQTLLNANGTYTITEDCFIRAYLLGPGAKALVNNEVIWYIGGMDVDITFGPIFCKAGSIIKLDGKTGCSITMFTAIN